jgi:Ras-related protein Rab-32
MDRYCADNGFVGWSETSAKDNVNIDKAAKLLVQAILDSTVGNANAAGHGDNSGAGVSLDKPTAAPAKSGGCC